VSIDFGARRSDFPALRFMAALKAARDLGLDQEAVNAAAGGLIPKYDRLVALKDRYEPDNLFRLNPNVRPSTQTGERVLA
jgi:hypothetical protein